MPCQICDITSYPYFESIEVCNYICPILYCVELRINHIISNFLLRFVDYMLEKLPHELIVARKVYASSKDKSVKATSKHLLAEENYKKQKMFSTS